MSSVLSTQSLFFWLYLLRPGGIRDIEADFGARAFLAPDGHGPSQHLDPLLHGSQAHTRGLTPHLHRIKPLAVVLDEKGNTIIGPGNGDRQPGSLGMFAGIGEGFLKNAVDGNLCR